MASALESSIAGLGIAGSDSVYPAPNLRTNLCSLSPDQVELAEMLMETGQSHVFEHWTEPGQEDDEKRAFFEQVARLNASYPGGLAAYIKNARQLLSDSKAGKNPYDGFTPSVPTGEKLTFGDESFIEYEEAGIREARNAAFVLVAGGLGERLGYNGIKVALPSDSCTGTCFLQLYIESVLALQEASSKLVKGEPQKDIPFAIMTSDDTHSRTLALLESNAYFGMKPTQVTLLKQEKVACLEDNDARLALDLKNKYRVQTKPHGHGDVHSLLYSSGTLNLWRQQHKHQKFERMIRLLLYAIHKLHAVLYPKSLSYTVDGFNWFPRYDAGVRYILFFQDTNGLLFKAIPAALGVSTIKQYHVNSLAVPRKAKEANGGITKLTHADGRTMVINVEYNQLDPLLRATINPQGDANCETGYSPFPGNINQLILEIGPYIEELKRTGGAIKEFVNPKYKDASRTAFKSSTRLECMMQDYPKTLQPTARVGFTVVDSWLAYAPVKNNPEDAAKVPKGNPYHSATSGEMAIYRAHSMILRKAGVKVEDPKPCVFNGQEVEVWPRIIWKPKWGITFSDVKRKIKGSCSISQRSSMVIKGQNVLIEDLALDGALVVNSTNDAKVRVGGLVQNKGWVFEIVDYKDLSVPEEVRIRGFKLNKVEQLEGNH